MKKTLSVLLSVLLLLGTCVFALPAAAEEPAIIAQGYCGAEGDGTNLMWVLTNDGTMTISGTGEMTDFANRSDIPWEDAKLSIKKLVIEAGVTSVGSRAFADCENLTDVTIPEGVTTLKAYAFEYCGFTEITLPSTLRTLSGPVFYGARLFSIDIPEGVENLNGTFSECFNLLKVTIPTSMKTIVEGTFYEVGVHVVEYHGTQEQWDQMNIPHESSGSDLSYLLPQAYQNYLDGHDMGEVEHRIITPATCTEGGWQEWKVECTKCDLVSLDWRHEAIMPLNHSNAYEAPAVEATATAHGHTAGVWCPDCETWLSGDVVHNALGAQTVIRPATEEEEGLIDIVCTVCGETVRYTAEKLPHTEPQPSGTGDTGNGFWMRIQSAFRGFIDWFLRLFKWFG